jgi:Protein of unknown function (DUF3014)
MEQRYQRKRGDWLVWLLMLLVVAISAGIAFFVYTKRLALRSPPPPRPLAVASPAAPLAVSATPTVSRTPLPELDASDGFVRNLVAALSANPAWATWLATEGLVRRFVVVVDNVAEGLSPTKQMQFLAPKDKFKTVERGQSVFVNPKSYVRYDLVANVIDSLDPKGAAEAYRRLKPLIDQAYRELGYPDRRFDVTLAKAIDRLLETPVPGDDVALRPGLRSYKFADPELEAATPAQKQFMRIGPENMTKIQKKLRALREALALPAPRKER